MLQLNNGLVTDNPLTGNLNTLTNTDYTLYEKWNPSIAVQYPTYPVYYNYPVYITEDRTNKAIKILQLLIEKKMMKCDNINKFIELVNCISNLM